MLRVVAILLALCATAGAESGTIVDEAEAAVLALDIELIDSEHIDVAAALDLVALPFQVVGGEHACGTLTTKINAARFLRCLSRAKWTRSLEGPTGGLFELDTVPPVFRHHRKQIAALRKTHVVIASHFCPAAPGAHWTIYGARRGTDGKVRIDTIMFWNDDDGDCR